VLRRMESWRRWQQLKESGWRPSWQPDEPLTAATEPLWSAVQAHVGEVPRLLAPWLERTLPIQPCVCDLWHDHVLFTNDAVTGLIDFASAKPDHVAVDLSRLLGSMVGDDADLWEAGCTAYEQICPLSSQDRALASDLDRTGTIVAGMHWLRWLYHERRQ